MKQEQERPIRKILVVDDNPVILKTMVLKLEPAGYLVYTAPDGATALEFVRRNRPDLILLDIHFPPDVTHYDNIQWDGISLLHWLQRIKSTADIPVIIISSSDPAKNRDKVLAAGALAFLQKPIQHEDLLIWIQKAIDQKQADGRGEPADPGEFATPNRIVT